PDAITDQRDALAYLVEVYRTDTGHALQRDVIDVTTARLRNVTETLLGGRRCQQEDRIEPRLAHFQREFMTLLRRIIHDQHTIDTCSLGPFDKVRHAHGFDRIGVAHQHHRRTGVGLTELAHELNDLAQAHALGERTL